MLEVAWWLFLATSLVGFGSGLANGPDCSTATCFVTIVSGSTVAPCTSSSTASRARPAVMR